MMLERLKEEQEKNHSGDRIKLESCRCCLWSILLLRKKNPKTRGEDAKNENPESSYNKSIHKNTR